ncbi:hypothetical protein ACIQJ4_34875 [Streptomyces filamentosus]|uniref:hypothetical protein n=1 Tax=Streptomyces filamentosus TaxID=67294 RepID=UPI00382EE761
MALAQVERVRAELAALHPGIATTVLPVKTTGDKWMGGLSRVEGKGAFTKEAVPRSWPATPTLRCAASMTSPSTGPAGTAFAAFLKRNDIRDALVHPGKRTYEAPAGNTTPERRTDQLNVDVGGGGEQGVRDLGRGGVGERAPVRDARPVAGAAGEGVVDDRRDALVRDQSVGGLDVGVGPSGGVYLSQPLGPRPGDAQEPGAYGRKVAFGAACGGERAPHWDAVDPAHREPPAALPGSGTDPVAGGECARVGEAGEVVVLLRHLGGLVTGGVVVGDVRLQRDGTLGALDLPGPRAAAVAQEPGREGLADEGLEAPQRDCG